MKVLQTLGRHGGTQEGIFQYKRSADAVIIDHSVGTATLKPAETRLSTAEWTNILQAIEGSVQKSFRITPATGSVLTNSVPPNQNLYDLLSNAVPNPTGWNWNDSRKAAICAVLEHEGSIDLYHGPLGPSNVAHITLCKDI